MANLLDDRQVQPLPISRPESVDVIAVFGASGTAGNGGLKAAILCYSDA